MEGLRRPRLFFLHSPFFHSHDLKKGHPLECADSSFFSFFSHLTRTLLSLSLPPQHYQLFRVELLGSGARCAQARPRAYHRHSTVRRWSATPHETVQFGFSRKMGVDARHRPSATRRRGGVGVRRTLNLRDDFLIYYFLTNYKKKLIDPDETFFSSFFPPPSSQSYKLSSCTIFIATSPLFTPSMLCCESGCPCCSPGSCTG